MKNALILFFAFMILTPAAYAQKVSGKFQGGSVKVGADTGTCNSSREGAIRYNTTNQYHEFCNGTSWAAITFSITTAMMKVQSDYKTGPAIATCTAPACDAGYVSVGCNVGETWDNTTTVLYNWTKSGLLKDATHGFFGPCSYSANHPDWGTYNAVTCARLCVQ